jgi:hypothetical protein
VAGGYLHDHNHDEYDNNFNDNDNNNTTSFAYPNCGPNHNSDFHPDLHSVSGADGSDIVADDVADARPQPDWRKRHDHSANAQPYTHTDYNWADGDTNKRDSGPDTATNSISDNTANFTANFTANRPTDNERTDNPYADCGANVAVNCTNVAANDVSDNKDNDDHDDHENHYFVEHNHDVHYMGHHNGERLLENLWRSQGADADFNKRIQQCDGWASLHTQGWLFAEIL